MKRFKNLDITGPDEQLLALIDAVSTSLPAGWRRDFEAEAGIERDPAGIDAGFAFARDAKEGDPKTGLFLARDRGRLHVPNIVPLDGQLSIGQYNRVLDEFADILRTHLPSGSQLNMHITSDEAAITDWVSKDAAALLRGFATLANMSTGSAHPLDFERWAHFLIQVHKEGSTLYSDSLSRWLVEELEWPPERADELTREYEFARDLLKVYDQS